MKQMLRVFLTFSFSFLLLTQKIQAQEPPNYEAWQCLDCFGKMGKTCFEDLSFSNTVLLFKDTRGKEVLLAWGNYERNTEHFVMHGSLKSYRTDRVTYNFYEKRSGYWSLLETKKLSRDQFPPDTPVELFDKQSPFGKRFVKLLKKHGIKENEMDNSLLSFSFSQN